MGSYRQLTGMQTPPDRPQAIPPVPEEYEGTNYPYRGVEAHGVPSPNGVNPEAYYEATGYDLNPDQYTPVEAEKEPDPVPVKIVNETARERYHFRTGTQVIPVGSGVIQIMGRNDRRSEVMLRVPGSSAGSVLVSNNRDMSPGVVYTLGPGNEVKFRTTEEVFVIASNTAVAPTLMYMETYTVGL